MIIPLFWEFNRISTAASYKLRRVVLFEFFQMFVNAPSIISPCKNRCSKLEIRNNNPNLIDDSCRRQQNQNISVQTSNSSLAETYAEAAATTAVHVVATASFAFFLAS